MGNADGSPHGRSYSDDMMNAQQRHHAKSDEIPYNYPQRPSKKQNGQQYFSAKHHNHYSGNNKHHHHHNGHNNNNNNNHRLQQSQPLPHNKKNKTKTKTKTKTIQQKKHHHLHLENNDSDPNDGRSMKSRSSHSSRNTTASFGRSISESGNKVLIMEGWLTKLGESSKKLKKRYWKLYDTGKLSYNTKQTGNFKKYADLKVGIDAMSLKDDNGFQVEVAKRTLIFYAENTKDRDSWFGLIFSHFFQKGQKDLDLLRKTSDKFKNGDKGGPGHGLLKEEDDKFDENNNNQHTKPTIKDRKNGKKKWMSSKKGKKRRESFDSTKLHKNNRENAFKPPNAAYTNPNGAVYPHQNKGKNGQRQRSQSRGYVQYMKKQEANNHHNNHNNNNGYSTGGGGGTTNESLSNETSKTHTATKTKSSKEDGMIIFSEQYMNQECDGKTCLSLERVHYVLKKYDGWRNSEKKIMSLGMYRYVNNGLGEHYNNTHLLNDFNHLIEFHDNVFNHIYEYFDGECDLEKCLLIKRLHRDRDYYKNDAKRKEIYYNYDDAKEINTQQILDKIHCYYRHSYDLGFRVKKSKLLSIQKNAKNHRRFGTNSRSARVSSFITPANNNNNKLVNNISNTKQNQLEESKEATHIIFNNDTLTDNESEDEERIKRRKKRSQHQHRKNTYGSTNNRSRRPTSDLSDIESDIEQNNDDDPEGFEDEWKLLEICGLIQQKRSNLRGLRGTQRINTNKFIGKVGKSQRYHYWNKYDDDDDSNWLIQKKYIDFKKELLSNDLYTLSLKQWEYLYEKASDHFGMKRSKKIRPHKYWAELYELPRESAHSFSITKSHLIAILLYCNYDILQREFAKTHYKQIVDNETNENETNEELKLRHSNFYHFGRLLRELIECFGKKIYNKNIVFYHGITDDMMFIETTMYFHCPLSTTTSIEVAIAYSNNNDNDYLLELMDDDTVLGMARYFDCCWLSDFGNECEKFFIGGYKPLKIHTVLDAVLGRNYINYLKALHIIDEMFQGYYIDTESDEIKQIILHLLQSQISLHKQKRSKPEGLNNDLLKEVQKLNKKPSLYMDVISENIKSVDTLFSDIDMNEDDEKSMNDSRRRVSRKISSTFTQSRMSTIDMEEYDYFNETPKYITKLVDFYCINVINVCVDYQNMNEKDWKSFKFCKKLLCIDKYEWIKLSVFLTLFPNLKEINVRNIKLAQKTIENIYQFILKKIICNNHYESLYRIEIFEVDQTVYPIATCIEQYLDKFKDMGWTITFNPFEDEMCILKL